MRGNYQTGSFYSDSICLFFGRGHFRLIHGTLETFIALTSIEPLFGRFTGAEDNQRLDRSYLSELTLSVNPLPSQNHRSKTRTREKGEIPG